jgi:excisionase family DNA binding protein
MSTIYDIESQKKLQQHYRLKTVAEMCDVSEKTVYRWIYEGRIKAHRIGGSIRIPKSELVLLIQSV